METDQNLEQEVVEEPKEEERSDEKPKMARFAENVEENTGGVIKEADTVFQKSEEKEEEREEELGDT